MTTKVVNVEDAHPYIEVLTDAEIFSDMLRETAELFEESAIYYRSRKEWGYAKLEADIATELKRIAKTKDPETEMTWMLRNMAYQMTELRAAARDSRNAVVANKKRNEKK